MIVRDRIYEWVKKTVMLGDVKGGFRRSRRTDNNMFMLDRMVEIAKVRGECFYIGFMDMEKAYDRVNRRKLFEVKRSYGIHEKLVKTIARVYEDSRVKFELNEFIADWCKSDSGVRQGCPLSPLLFSINVRELGMTVQKSDNASNMFQLEKMERWKTRPWQVLFMQMICVCVQVVRTAYKG